MRKLFLFTILLGFALTLNAQSKVDQKIKFQDAYNTFKSLVETNQYKFIGEWFFSDDKREKVNEDSNVIKIHKLNSLGQLTKGLTNKNEIIDFNSSITNYSVSFDDENQNISIAFDIASYDIVIDVKANGHSFFKASSSDGKLISWRGKIKSL